MDPGIEVLVEGLERLLVALRHQRVDALRWESVMLLYGFDVDRSELADVHREQLDELIDMFSSHPHTTAVDLIVGRASQTGAEANNQALAFARAETVRAHLVDGGVAAGPGLVVSRGSAMPYVHAPGREEELNRSVEVFFQWQTPVVEPDTISAGGGETGLWNISFDRAIGAGGGVGGQVLEGKLTKRARGESRTVQAFLGGAKAGIGWSLASGSEPVDAFDNGDFETPHAVDWDWFDGQPIAMVEIGAAAVVGGLSGATLYFPRGVIPVVRTRTASIPSGLVLEVGVSAMVGLLNVHDR